MNKGGKIMTEKNKKQRQIHNKNQFKKKPDNFFIHELKERAEIKKQSYLFKKAVDDEKVKQLRMIEEYGKVKEAAINDKISQLEDVIKSDNPELIKQMLKNMQI